MKLNYKNIVITAAVVAVIGVFTIASVTNNKNTSDNSAKTKVELQVRETPITNDLKTTQKEVKQKIGEVGATLTVSPLQDRELSSSLSQISSTTIENSTISSKNIIEKINDIVAEKYPEFEVTMAGSPRSPAHPSIGAPRGGRC